MAAAAALAFATPFAFASPAQAAVNSDSEQASLTFVTFSGATVTCTLLGVNEHDTDSRTAQVQQISFRTSDATFAPECRGNHQMTVAYKDEEGDENTFRPAAADTNDMIVFVQGVQGNVRATHLVFFTQCDRSQSAACFLTVQTSTK
jgi:hypothetical protein